MALFVVWAGACSDNIFEISDNSINGNQDLSTDSDTDSQTSDPGDTDSQTEKDLGTDSEPQNAVHPKMFVTSVQGNGNLSSWPDANGATGIAAGDAICQARAGAAGLPGQFAAYLSDAQNDAYCRLNGQSGTIEDNCNSATLPNETGPWYRTDAHPFGLSAAEIALEGGFFYVPATLDEFGEKLVNIAMFTGSTDFGTAHTNHCNSWTSAESTDSAAGSKVYSCDFFANADEPCDESTCALMCFQLQKGDPPTLSDPNGLRVFLSSAQGSGNLNTWTQSQGVYGIDAGDAICQTLADEAGLNGIFKAWLSTDSVGALDRLVADGPWYRLDYVLVANNKADLTDGELFTTISLTETGVYHRTSSGEWGAWTGTSRLGEGEAYNCNDWQSSDESFYGVWGVSTFTYLFWSDTGNATTCDREQFIYCFEDTI